jgi:hypothetical protein
VTTLSASFYDGKTSQKKEVQLQFYASGELVIRGLEDELKYSLVDVRISARVGNTPRSLYLPGGAKCETFDNDAVDAFLERHRRHRGSAWLHMLESKLRYVALALNMAYRCWPSTWLTHCLLQSMPHSARKGWRSWIDCSFPLPS